MSLTARRSAFPGDFDDRDGDKHYGLKKLQLVVCVDDWGTDTCRASGVQVNPRF